MYQKWQEGADYFGMCFEFIANSDHIDPQV